jgi:hypothetical protein
MKTLIGLRAHTTDLDKLRDLATRVERPYAELLRDAIQRCLVIPITLGRVVTHMVSGPDAAPPDLKEVTFFIDEADVHAVDQLALKLGLVKGRNAVLQIILKGLLAGIILEIPRQR